MKPWLSDPGFGDGGWYTYPNPRDLESLYIAMQIRADFIPVVVSETQEFMMPVQTELEGHDARNVALVAVFGHTRSGSIKAVSSGVGISLRESNGRL